MADDLCDWMTEGVRLPEYASLPDVYKKIQLQQNSTVAHCEQFCPGHACSIAEQNRAFNQFILT